MQVIFKAATLALLALALPQRSIGLHGTVPRTGAGLLETAAALLDGFMLMDTAMAVEVSRPEIQPSSDAFVLGSRAFSIPFSVETTGNQPAAVHLYVKPQAAADSRQEDHSSLATQGSTSPDGWILLDHKLPSIATKEFQFTAPQDGEFWFATRTVDSEGKIHPAGKIEPQLKVFVDTTRPHLKLQVDATPDGQLTAKLEVKDVTQIKQMRLRYATDTSQKWQDLAVDRKTANSVVTIRPDADWKKASVQLIATDEAGNQNAVHQQLQRPRLATADKNTFAALEKESRLSAQNVAADRPAEPPQADRTEAMPAPYRTQSGTPAAAHTVSDPVIRLDRYRGGKQLGGNDHSGPAFNRGPAQSSPAPATTRAAGPYLAPYNPTRAHPANRTAVPQQPTTRNPYRTAPPTASSVPAGASMRGPTAGNENAAARPNRAGVTGQLPAAGIAFPFGQAFPGLPPANDPAAAGSNAAGSPVGSTAAASRPAASDSESLPPPATPEQITNGFVLNPANGGSIGNTPGAGKPGPPAATAPTATNADTTGAPPANQDAEADPSPPRSPARSASEAMRPIDEESAVTRWQPGTAEEVPPPRGEVEPSQQDDAGPSYRSQRKVTPDRINDLSQQRAPVRFSDSNRFSLAYELESIGNQGVDAIELYGSTDSGKTWKLWGRDPDKSSPFDIETKEEGVFGFRIVVVGQNGLASPRPQPGDAPDIAVVVDQTEPQVRITGAQYGQGDRTGALIIRYECADKHLVKRPVALSFSDSPDGPWTTIAAGLRNDGDYVWPADPQLPRQIYLRIDVTDEAGNVGTYLLDRPIDAQGLAPRARIRGFEPLSLQSTEGESQTAGRLRAIFK